MKNYRILYKAHVIKEVEVYVTANSKEEATLKFKNYKEIAFAEVISEETRSIDILDVEENV